MTLNEIEVLIKELQRQVAANTAAIVTLNNTVSNYATTDDFNALSKQINTLQNNNILLQDTIAALKVDVSKVDHLSKLNDVLINNIAENDVLQFGNDGLWHNVQPTKLGISGGASGSGGVTKLSELTDVYISGVSNGQALVYSSISNRWINSNIETSGNGGSGDLSGYLTTADAQKLYLPIAGGTITGPLTVKGLTNLGNDLLVTGGITFYNT